MRRAALLLVVLAGCGSGLSDVEVTLEPDRVEPFVEHLAQHTEALDAEDAPSLARTLLAMATPGDLSMRRTKRRDGRLVATLELDASRGSSGSFSLRIRTDRETAREIERFALP